MKRTSFSILIASILFNISCPKYAFAANNWENLPLESQNIVTLENTPWGLFAGENDFNSGSQNHNGIYISSDNGSSWGFGGLSGRGVTDIHYYEDKLYATTQFVKEGTVGTFVSYDNGNNWEQFELINFNSTCVSSNEKVILVGTISKGLWKSTDEGNSWEQVLGTGYYGPKIYEIEVYENIILVSTENEAYASWDSGNTWSILDDLNNKKIRKFEAIENIVFAGSINSEGLYISKDLGLSWEKVESWGNNSTGDITYFNNVLYIGRTDNNGYRTIFASKDLGNSWENINLISQGNFADVLDIEWQYTEPSNLYAVTHNDGIYKKQISNINYIHTPFLRIPWDYNEPAELIDKISSYFDHKYPLLGYRYFAEPIEENASTLTFYGESGSTPEIYYSAHNGYDFALPYGTEALATANGYATYYYCSDCGHSIKIDHLNGLETTYQHLQIEGLVTTDQIPKWIIKGDVIGKVGMTGNTSGPHLHINITKDVNNDGTFINDFPYGITDPFGWQSNNKPDPWETLTWDDVLGSHFGTSSKYLWKDEVPITQTNVLNSQSTTLSNNNKTVIFDQDSFENNFVAKILPYSKAILPNSQKYLSYIANSSFIIKLLDTTYNEINKINRPVEIVFDFSNADLSNIVLDTLKIYHWEKTLKLWQPLNTLELDLINKSITATTDTFSHFAVFGYKTNHTTPNVQITITGNKDEKGWFNEYPILKITPTNSDFDIYYKLGNDIDWTKYIDQIELKRDGVFGINIRLLNKSDEVVDTKESELIKVNLNNRVGTVKIEGATFTLTGPN